MHGRFALVPGERAQIDLPGVHVEPFGILVTMRIEGGAVSLACLGPDGVTVVDEARVAATGAPVTVSLLADAPSGPLRVVNTAAEPSFLTIDDVACVAVAATDLWPAALSEPSAVPGWSRYYGSRGDNLAEKARYRRYARLDAPLTVTWRDGLRFRIAPADQLSRVVYVSGTYEPATLRLLRAWLGPGRVFVDAGANAGVVTLAAATWVGPSGRVLAIEPSAREFARLADHVALNGLGQVTAIRAAVAATPGERVLRVAAAPRGGLNTLGDRFAYPDMPMAGVELVEARPIDAMIAEADIDHVDVVKLDVEGSETDALEGAGGTLHDCRPALVIEVCASALTASGSSVEALDARLRDADYTCFEIDDATGALLAAGPLSAQTDRNVAALPVERAAALLDLTR